VREALEALITEMIEKGILFDEAVTEFEGRFISKVLSRHGGNRCRAAAALGMHRNTLSRRLSELNLSSRKPAAKAAVRTAKKRATR
jgi:DNA-binding NtrC family response regulator